MLIGIHPVGATGAFSGGQRPQNLGSPLSLPHTRSSHPQVILPDPRGAVAPRGFKDEGTRTAGPFVRSGDSIGEL